MLILFLAIFMNYLSALEQNVVIYSRIQCFIGVEENDSSKSGQISLSLFHLLFQPSSGPIGVRAITCMCTVSLKHWPQLLNLSSLGRRRLTEYMVYLIKVFCFDPLWVPLGIPRGVRVISFVFLLETSTSRLGAQIGREQVSPAVEKSRYLNRPYLRIDLSICAHLRTWSWTYHSKKGK